MDQSVYPVSQQEVRISVHTASRIEELMPRAWKESSPDSPMRSVLDRKVNDAPE
jgi:hypothetical protein